MAERTARLYSQAPPRELLSDLGDRLGAAGLSLQHPESGKVFRISDEGDQLATTEEDLRAHLADLGDVSFSWWISADHDLYCRIRKCDKAAVVELGLEGCTAGELSVFQKLLRNWAASEANAGRLLGFVYDRDGVSEDCDWDQFFLESVPLEIACKSADLLSSLLPVENSDYSRLPSPDRGIPITERDGFILAARSE